MSALGIILLILGCLGFVVILALPALLLVGPGLLISRTKGTGFRVKLLFIVSISLFAASAVVHTLTFFWILPGGAGSLFLGAILIVALYFAVSQTISISGKSYEERFTIGNQAPSWIRTLVTVLGVYVLAMLFNDLTRDEDFEEYAFRVKTQSGLFLLMCASCVVVLLGKMRRNIQDDVFGREQTPVNDPSDIFRPSPRVAFEERTLNLINHWATKAALIALVTCWIGMTFWKEPPHKQPDLAASELQFLPAKLGGVARELTASQLRLAHAVSRLEASLSKVEKELAAQYTQLPLAERQSAINKLAEHGKESVPFILRLMRPEQPLFREDLLKALSKIMETDLTARYSGKMTPQELEKLNAEVEAWRQKNSSGKALKGSL
ncbi:MAG: hypothetical protein NTX50_30510 [Candidatus Sumerlaeota bacterium]|nr:hypothetical protein [Candidatus Sumerlaeota bacterium]